MSVIEFGIKDAIDILLVAVMFYEGFRLLRRSGAANLFWGILAFAVAWFLVSFVFQLELTGAIFDRVISVAAIALIVIFQDEIRSFFYRLGARFSGLRLIRHGRQDAAELNHAIEEILLACEHMSESRTGALIVLCGEQSMKEYTDTGEHIDAQISARMIENIFFKNTPLHDGALFIVNGRLDAAACILPVSHNQSIPQHYGLRHRAALGLTEKTDTTAIVVSEETGAISVSRGDVIQPVSLDQLQFYLRSAFAMA